MGILSLQAFDKKPLVATGTQCKTQRKGKNQRKITVKYPPDIRFFNCIMSSCEPLLPLLMVIDAKGGLLTKITIVLFYANNSEAFLNSPLEREDVAHSQRFCSSCSRPIPRCFYRNM
jgi:hypothetical protein